MRKFTKYILLVLTLLTSFLLTACSCSSCNDDETYIELNKETTIISIEGEDKLSVTYYGEISEGEKPVWSVENSDIVSVNERGVIKGKRVGVTNVICQVGDYTDTCEVTVNTGSYLPTLCFENIDEGNCKILAGTAFDFGAYVRYAGKDYKDLTIEYELSKTGHGTVSANRFVANYNTGFIEVTATAEWRGVKSILLTKTFTVEVIDNISISVENVVDNVSLYTFDSHMGQSYPTASYFNINVVENGSDVALDLNNLSVVVADQTIATYSTVDSTLKANQNGKHGITQVKIIYTSTKGVEYLAYYNVSVERPVYDTGEHLGYFSALTDKIDFDSIIGSGETITDAKQYNIDGSVKNLTYSDNEIKGYKSFSSGVNESEFVLYTQSQVAGKTKTAGYKVSADVYGYLIRNKEDISELASVPENGNISIAVTQNIDATGVTFNTISSFSGSFDGLGHTISNVSLQSGGLFARFNKGSKFCNVAFVNVRLTAGKTALQYVIGGNTDSKNNYCTIENVYATVNEQDIIAREYENFGVFASIMDNLVVRNVVVEYPSMPLKVSQELNFGSKYGLFANDGVGLKATDLGVINYNGVFVISKSVDGNPVPLIVARQSHYYVSQSNGAPNGDFIDGIRQYLVYARNDIGSEIVTSDQKSVSTKYTYNPNDGVGVNAQTGVQATKHLFYITPQYEIKLIDGKLEIIPVNTYAPNQTPIENYKSAWVTSNKKDRYSADYSLLEGRFGIMVMGSSISRYDSYYDFIANRTSTAAFNNSWDTSYGYPIWKNTLINDIGVTANGNVVSKIELVYDREDTSRISAEVGLQEGSYNVENVEYELVAGSDVVSLSGTTVTAISAGSAFIEIKFTTVDGTPYSKYVEIDVSLIPGEYQYEQSENLLFSALDGKIYDKNFNEVSLKDIFGVDVELDSAMLNGSKVTISSDKKYVTGAKATDSVVKQGDLRLGFKGTYYTINIDIYAGILSTAKDLQTVFEINSSSKKIQGYYILKNDITYDFENYPIKHINGNTDTLAKAGGFMNGVLDGNGHKIDGFIMEDDGTSGMFGIIGANVEIKNIAFTNVGLIATANVTRGATLFGWQAGKNFKLTNAYLHFSNNIIEKNNTPYGIFGGIIYNTNFKMSDVIVDMPTSPSYSAMPHNGRGLFIGFDDRFADYKVNGATGEDNPNNIFKNVYIISAPAANGKIFTIIDRVLPYYCDPNNRGSKLSVAANDYVGLPDGIVETEGGHTKLQNGYGNNKYFTDKAVSINYNADANLSGSGIINPYPEGRTEVGVKDNSGVGTAVLWHIMTIYRYDSAEAMANAGKSTVGTWNVSASGVVWAN